MSNTFRVAPFSVTAWVWTIGFIIGIIYFAGRSLLVLSAGGSPDLFDVGAAAVLIVLTVYAWLRSVRAYTIEGDTVLIVRGGPGKLHIALSEVKDVAPRPNIGAFFNTGFLSIGGLFGWAGKTRVRHTKDIKAQDVEVYGTNAAKAVALEMKTGLTIILTPQDPEGLAQAIRKAGLRKTGSAYTKPAATPAKKRR